MSGFEPSPYNDAELKTELRRLHAMLESESKFIYRNVQCHL